MRSTLASAFRGRVLIWVRSHSFEDSEIAVFQGLLSGTSVAMSGQPTALAAASNVAQEPLQLFVAVADSPEAVIAPQNVAVRDNPGNNVPTRIGVGKSSKACAHLLLGPERANILFNELWTLTWTYGNCSWSWWRHQSLMKLTFDGSEKQMVRFFIFLLVTKGKK